MRERLLIAGSGGQGVISLGKLVARLSVETIPHVTFFPAYGAEVRGGTAHCQVILASDEIASPVAESFDSMLLMNEPSAHRFLPLLDPRGLALLNHTLCERRDDPRCVPFPATDIADRLGNRMAANLVMLGAWLARKPLLDAGAVEAALPVLFRNAAPALIEINRQALRAGLTGGAMPA